MEKDKPCCNTFKQGFIYISLMPIVKNRSHFFYIGFKQARHLYFLLYSGSVDKSQYTQTKRSVNKVMMAKAFSWKV